MTRSVRFFLILGIGLLVLDGALLLIGRPPSASYRGATVISTGTAAIGGPFALAATDGTTVTDATYRGKWMLIYFGYTFCPDACPTVLTNMTIALKTLRNEADRVQPLFITVDPRRDTRQVLGEYLKSFDPRIIGLTGSEEQTAAAAKAYKVYIESRAGEGEDNYLVDHSSFVYLMDPLGKFSGVISGATSGEEMAARLRKLMDEHSTCERGSQCAIPLQR
jgi:protein SCO1